MIRLLFILILPPGFLDAAYQVQVSKPSSSVEQSPLWQRHLEDVSVNHQEGPKEQNKVKDTTGTFTEIYNAQNHDGEIKNKRHHSQKGMQKDPSNSNHAAVDFERDRYSAQKNLPKENKQHTRTSKQISKQMKAQVNDIGSFDWEENKILRKSANSLRSIIHQHEKANNKESLKFQKQRTSTHDEEKRFMKMDSLIIDQMGEWFQNCYPVTMTGEKKVYKQPPFKCMIMTKDILRKYSVPCITFMYFFKRYPC